VVSGKGTLNWKYKIKKGDCFIVNSNIKKLFIVGRVKAIVTYINEQNIPQQLLNK
jgi:mannose-6-phosphate isomerase class I